METKVTLSKKFSLNGGDFLRGLVIAALTSVIYVVQESLTKGQLTFDWKAIGAAAVSGGIAYLIKNYGLEPAKVITSTSTNTKAENAQERIKEAI